MDVQIIALMVVIFTAICSPIYGVFIFLQSRKRTKRIKMYMELQKQSSQQEQE